MALAVAGSVHVTVNNDVDGNKHIHGNRRLLSIRLSGLLQQDCVEPVYPERVAQAIAVGRRIEGERVGSEGDSTPSRTTSAGNCKRRRIACSRKVRLTVLGPHNALREPATAAVAGYLQLAEAFVPTRKLAYYTKRRVPRGMMGLDGYPVELPRLPVIILPGKFRARYRLRERYPPCRPPMTTVTSDFDVIENPNTFYLNRVIEFIRMTTLCRKEGFTEFEVLLSEEWHVLCELF